MLCEHATSALPEQSTTPASSVFSLLGLQTLNGESSHVGDTEWHRVPFELRLRRALTYASAATHRGILPPPLRSLANAVMPNQMVVDCGGQGQCGPNTLAYLLSLVGLFDGPGEDLREIAVSHAQLVMEGLTNLKPHNGAPDAFTLRDLISDSINSWPENLRRGLPPSVESWLQLIRQRESWTDIAFVQACADKFRVCFALTGVNDLGYVSPMFVVSPLDHAAPFAWLEIGCWLNRHFVAIVNIDPPPVEADLTTRVGAADLLDEEVREWGSFEWPLTRIEEVERLLRCRHICPSALVGMEFSGAVRLALEEQGIRALSVDLRTCDVGGMHFQGDVRLVLGLQKWSKVYLFPPCFQQFRHDDCLVYKIADGRSFWGIAFVLWCLCVPTADSLLVEQSDTIVADYIPVHLLPDVAITEAHTSDFGDSSSKLVRLFHRNLRLHTPPKRPAPPYEPFRSQFRHATPEQRDRARSSWAQFPKTSGAVALAPPKRTGDYKPPPLDYITLVSLFARAWATAGFPVPKDFRNHDARPSNPSDREYQLERGAGDGREVDAVEDLQSILAPPPLEPPPLPSGSAPHPVEPSITLVSSAVDPLVNRPTPHLEELDSSVASFGPCGDSSSVERAAKLMLKPLTFIRHGLKAIFLVVLCMAARPMVYAHREGCTLYGFVPAAGMTTSAISSFVRRDVATRWGESALVFLAGQYQDGPRLYVAAVAHEERALSNYAGLDKDGFEWMSATEARQLPSCDPIIRALFTVQMFIRPIEEWTAAYDAAFQSGRSQPTDIVSLLEETEGAPPAWRAIQLSTQADRALLSLLEESSNNPMFDGWVDALRPLPIDSLPASLLLSLSSFDDDRLTVYPLPEVFHPYSTRKLPIHPAQTPRTTAPMQCPRPKDLYLEHGYQRLASWLSAQRADLVETRRQLDDGVHPDAVTRPHRPSPIAIGQSEMQPWARQLLWDCRRDCCTPLDVREPVSSNLSLAYLANELADYPDQELYSHLLDGVSLEADVELQTVLVPHLTSLPRGFASVVKELRRLQQASWYDFYWEPPFVPFYLNGQGSVARKLEPDRFRRSTEGGGPRKPTFDASGLQAVSINYASHYRYIPAHFLSDKRPEFLEWIQKRDLSEALERARLGLPSDPNMDAAGARTRFTKWPKEVKPTVAEAMQALAILKRAGALLNQDVYLFGDDLKDYFNQMSMRTPELWKLNIVFVEEPGDQVQNNAARPSGEAQLLFVSEKRLGFGTHGASNVAQRFSYAILDVFRSHMDELDAQFDEGANAWRQARQKLGHNCHNTSQYRKQKTPGVQVCPQHRLYAAFMYTDDPIFIVVGAERAMRAISVWRQLVQNAQLLTAIPEKRSIGSWAAWLGVVFVASLGVVFVPQTKLLRALAAVIRTLELGCEFHEYRALCGLLEHLRGVLLKGKGVMHGLYAPHGPNGASRHGPSGWVECDPLMRKQLQRWRTLILQAGGISVQSALLRCHLTPHPDIVLVFDSDACHGDAGDPSGIGGFSHGLYWYYSVDPIDYDWVNTPGLEFMGVCFSVLMADYLLSGAEVSEALVILLRTDALTTALTLPSEAQRSPFLVSAFSWISQSPQWLRLRSRLRVQHIFGEHNVMADAVSRAHWQTFAAYCARLNITPRRLELHPAAHSLVDHCRQSLLSTTSPAFSSRDLVCGALTAPPAVSPGLLRLRELAAANPDAAPPARTSTSQALERASEPSPPMPAARSPAISRLLEAAEQPNSPVVAPSRPAAMVHRTAPTAPPQKVVSPTRSLPTRLQDSALTRASVSYAAQTASSFVGSGPMDFNVAPHSLIPTAMRLAEASVSGINDSTHAIDTRAWSMWETVCSWYNTSPLRTAADVRDNPQRACYLLASLMLHAFAVCKPRRPGAQHVKPNSAFAYPLAVIRIFGRWGVAIPVKALKSTLHQLSRYYLQLHGQYSLVPRRAEPMKYAMVLRMHRVAEGTLIKDMRWSDTQHDVFMFRRLNLVIWPTGCRLAEFVGGHELMHFTFESLSWSINGLVVVAPTKDQLNSLRPGRDYARLTPPRSKPDQFGETHCPFPIVLMFEKLEGNAAEALRDLELRCNVAHSDRPSKALFHDSRGRPYTHSRLDRLLKAVLTHCFGAAVASAYSWHSYRSGLATALHAAGVDDARIQLICRWLCPASLLVYRRMGSAEYSSLTSSAMRTHADTLQSQNIMRLADAPEYADLLKHPVSPRDWEIAVDNQRLVRSSRDVQVTKAHQRNAPIVSNNEFYADFFAAATSFDIAEATTTDGLIADVNDSADSAAPATSRRRASSHVAAPTPARPAAEQCAVRPPQKRKRAAAPPAPASDRDSTTGVGTLRFRFPKNLSKYRTYNKRKSKRRAPTDRSRPTRPPCRD